MNFILEKDNDAMETECFLWKQLLKSAPQHKYFECTTQDIHSIPIPLHKQYIPLGSIDFTNKCLSKFYNIPKMNSIEIPSCLRNDEFLGRQYKIASAQQIPTAGVYFVKDASDMKRFSFYGDTQNIKPQDINPHNLYVISEVVDIISEYRVYFLHGKIYAIEYYNGDPTVLPDIGYLKFSVV